MAAIHAWKLSLYDYWTIMTSEINMVAKHGKTINSGIEDTTSEVSSMCAEEEIISMAIQMKIITPEEGAIRLAEIKKVIKEAAGDRAINMNQYADGTPTITIGTPPGLPSNFDQVIKNYIDDRIRTAGQMTIQQLQMEMNNMRDRIDAKFQEITGQLGIADTNFEAL